MKTIDHRLNVDPLISYQVVATEYSNDLVRTIV
jgi:hypothetical protein